MAEKKETLLTYKGRPLVRSGNTLYYGDMSERCVIVLQVMSTKTVGELEIADRVLVQLMLTDPEVRMKDRVLKKSEKNGLYNAMDFGCVWLERELKAQ